MILVDTSVWINHLRRPDPDLVVLLHENAVISHPYVIGEIACGNLANRQQVLLNLELLPHASEATHREASHLLNQNRLWGRGLGWVDIHLLASALLSGAKLWTADRRLREAADKLGISV